MVNVSGYAGVIQFVDVCCFRLRWGDSVCGCLMFQVTLGLYSLAESESAVCLESSKAKMYTEVNISKYERE